MAKLFAGLMGSYYNDPLGHNNPLTAHWANALGAVPSVEWKNPPGQGEFKYDTPFAKKPVSLVEKLSDFKSDLQRVDPGFARATAWDDPDVVRSTVQNLYQGYMNNYYQNRIAGKAGTQYITLPQYITAIQLDPKVKDVFKGLFPDTVWSATDTWWADVLDGAKKAGKSPQEWLFAG